MSEIVFLIEDDVDGGYTAHARLRIDFHPSFGHRHS